MIYELVNQLDCVDMRFDSRVHAIQLYNKTNIKYQIDRYQAKDEMIDWIKLFCINVIKTSNSHVFTLECLDTIIGVNVSLACSNLVIAGSTNWLSNKDV